MAILAGDRGCFDGDLRMTMVLCFVSVIYRVNKLQPFYEMLRIRFANE